MNKLEENFERFKYEKYVEIDTLSEYIDLIKRYISWIKKEENYCNCLKKNCVKKECKPLYRGESAKFKSPNLAGAFRSSLQPKDNSYDDFNNNLRDYISEIVNTLLDREMHFPKSVAQHHGLETNLVDVTSNALIALFFACKDSTKDGYVYIFEDYIDISALFSNYGDQLSILDELRELKNEQFIKDFFQIFNKRIYSCYIEDKLIILLEILYKDCPLFNELKDKVENNQIDSLIYIIIDKIGTRNERDQVIKIDDKYNLIIPDKSYIPDSNKITYANTKIYMLLLTLFLQKYYKNPNDYLYLLTGSEKINIIPNLFFKPAIPFERLNLQQGGFFVQQYMYNSIDDKIYLMQHITHSRVIRIRGGSKGDIIKDLDNVLNINIATIFGDRDSIALYMNEKNNKK